MGDNNAFNDASTDILRADGKPLKDALHRKSKARVLPEPHPLVKAYNETYLKKNKLYVYVDSFVKLDNIINLFFVNYANLPRSSYNCARLWVGVMQVRTQMTNAITHLVDQQRYLSPSYKDLRLSEMNNHINVCRIFVAKAVQYIVTFNKHKNEEDWTFLRKGFLSHWSEGLTNTLFGLSKSWMEFIVKAYEVGPETAIAYSEHLKQQDENSRNALHNVEPYSKLAARNRKVVSKLNELYQNRNKEEVKKGDYSVLRMQLCVAEDCIGTELNISPNSRSKVENLREEIDKTKSFLLENVERKILEDDDKVWPHQMGLEDLGPFQMVDVEKPENYFDYSVTDNSYSLKNGFYVIRGLGIFKNKIGACTELCDITLTKLEKESLEIPKAAVKYCFFYPLYVKRSDGEVVSKNDQEEEAISFNYAEELSPLHVLCLYGGFGYFNNKDQLLSLKGVTMGDDLFFDGPYFIPNENVFDQLEEHKVTLAEATLKPILAKKVTHFAWINPGQQKLFDLSKVNGGPKFWDFKGAFAYKYNNDGDEDSSMNDRRNYFQVLTFQEMNVKKEKNSNTPALSNLRILFNHHKKLWREEKDSEAAKRNEKMWEHRTFSAKNARKEKMWAFLR